MVELLHPNALKTTLKPQEYRENHYLCIINQNITESMEAIKSREQAINWLKNAQKRQQEWQQEVKQRWAERLQQTMATTV